MTDLQPKATEVLGRLALNPPASPAAIRLAENRLGIQFPDDYRSFLLSADGAEGDAGGDYVALWPVEEIADLNEGAEVATYAPSLTMFGGDGGGMRFGFVAEEGVRRYLSVDLITLSLDEAEEYGSTFSEFLIRVGGDS